MSWPDGSSQPQQARLAQALRDFGDATDQAVRAWAGQLTMRQALDITFVVMNILRLLGTTAERLSRYRAGSEPAPGYDAGPDQPERGDSPGTGEHQRSACRAGTSVPGGLPRIGRLAGPWR